MTINIFVTLTMFTLKIFPVDSFNEIVQKFHISRNKINGNVYYTK